MSSPRQWSTRGIGNETDVVVVDHSGGHFATRLWWALRYYGHDRVALLDGGFNKWTAEDRRVVTDVPSPAAATFRTQVRETLVADADQVNALIGDESVQVVDARDAETFSGVVFRGARAGHIPGAINVPAKALFAADGTWKERGGITATLNEFRSRSRQTSGGVLQRWRDRDSGAVRAGAHGSGRFRQLRWIVE